MAITKAEVIGLIKPHPLPKVLFYCLCYLIVLTTAENSILLYTLQEELPANTLIADISKDSGIKDELSPEVIKQLKYSFLDKSALFKIDENSGLLKTLGIIDRDGICRGEAICSKVIEVAIYPAAYFRVITVHVDILDINDNSPTFPVNSIAVNVSESADVGDSVIVLPSAYDPDSRKYGISGYRLSSPLPAYRNKQNKEIFSILEKKGLDGTSELQLILLEVLDRERVAFYQLDVTAYEGVSAPHTATLLVNISVSDSNDNPPVFRPASYATSVPEDAPIHSLILTVSAHDADAGQNGQIAYAFTARTQEKMGEVFSIDASTGEIYLTQELDFETENSYQLVVVASDSHNEDLSTSHTHTAQVSVQINITDINDFHPQLTINTLTATSQAEVKENLPRGTFIAYVSVIDLDSGPSGEVTCELNTTQFTLNAVQTNSGRYTVLTNEEFDREEVDSYVISLTCQDKGRPTALVTTHSFGVKIIDANDNSPVFKKEQYSAKIEENTEPSQFLLQVSASDADIGDNSHITYSLDPDNHQGVNSMFDIDTQGVLRTRVRLDHEEHRSVRLTVIARDGGEPGRSASAQVSVEVLDVNDCKPQFTQEGYSFNINENELPGITVGNVAATDKDSQPYDKINYKLEIPRRDVDGSQHKGALDNFRIDPYSGYIKSEYSLDREKQAVYYFTAVAYNPGFPAMSSTASVHIYIGDENDNNPVLLFPSRNNFTVYVQEGNILQQKKSSSVSKENSADNVQVIARIQAQDYDFGDNARLIYEIGGVVVGESYYTNERNADSRIKSQKYRNHIGRKLQSMFTLERKTGIISIERDSLPRSSDISQYNLTIHVRDLGFPFQKTSTCLLVVEVLPAVIEGGGVIAFGDESIDIFDDYEYSNSYNTGKTGEHRAPNITIVLAVACGSLLVVGGLILAVILLARRGRRMKNRTGGQYNSRVEAQSMLNGKPDSHSTDDCGNHGNTYTSLGDSLDNVSDTEQPQVTHKQYRNGLPEHREIQTHPVTVHSDTQLACDSAVSPPATNDRFATRLVPYTEKEIEIHKILKFLHSQQDGPPAHTDDSLSTSDSGRGTSLHDDSEDKMAASDLHRHMPCNSVMGFKKDKPYKPVDNQQRTANLHYNKPMYNGDNLQKLNENQQGSSVLRNSKGNNVLLYNNSVNSGQAHNRQSDHQQKMTKQVTFYNSDTNMGRSKDGIAKYTKLSGNSDNSEYTRITPVNHSFDPQNGRIKSDEYTNLNNLCTGNAMPGHNTSKHYGNGKLNSDAPYKRTTVNNSDINRYMSKSKCSKVVPNGSASVESVSVNGDLSDADTNSTMSGSYVLRPCVTEFKDTTV